MVQVMVTVDTEEDDWGSYEATGATAANIKRIPSLQELLARHGARATYFVNRVPLLSEETAEVLRALARDPSVEVGTHCHPWNTPPFGGPGGVAGSMMCNLSREANRSKVAEVTRMIGDVLEVEPRSFRTGRWGFGPSVAHALADLGYQVDSSVSPFIDWSGVGGPDFAEALLEPYRFRPDRPLELHPDGTLIEVPTTVAALRGDPLKQARTRVRLERTRWAQTGLIGVLDRLGVFARRWLSPEVSSAGEMIRLAENLVLHGVQTLDMTFHSCTLLPGATPFVRSEADLQVFLGRVEAFLSYCRDRDWRFATVSDVAASLT